MKKTILCLAALLLFAYPCQAAPAWVAAGWCTVQSGGDGWCDVGVGVPILEHRVGEKTVALVAAIGEGKTVALGGALVIRNSDPVIAIALGATCPYSDKGIDVSTVRPAVGLTLSF